MSSINNVKRSHSLFSSGNFSEGRASDLAANTRMVPLYDIIINYNVYKSKKTQWMWPSAINECHIPAVFPDGRQLVCQCGLCVTSSLSSCQGAEWKPGREGGSFWQTTASTTSNTQRWVSLLRWWFVRWSVSLQVNRLHRVKVAWI